MTSVEITYDVYAKLERLCKFYDLDVATTTTNLIHNHIEEIKNQEWPFAKFLAQ